MKTFAKLVSLLFVALFLLSSLAGCASNPAKGIIGNWVDVETEDNYLKIDKNTIAFATGYVGSYNIDEDKTFEFVIGSLLNDTLEWNEEKAKDGKSGYWFISGNTLYWDGDTFQRQK